MRAGAGLATVAVASLLVAGCGGGARGTHVQDPHAAVLRAGDMARGYAEGDDTACGIADTEEEDSPLARLFVEERPRACIIELARVWEGGTGPRGVTSAAYVFRNAAAAERGFRARSPLLEYSASLRMRTETGVDLGDEARLVRGPGLNDPAVAVVWRSGNVVAILAVEPASVRAALALARPAAATDPRPGARTASGRHDRAPAGRSGPRAAGLLARTLVPSRTRADGARPQRRPGGAYRGLSRVRRRHWRASGGVG